MGSGEFIPWRGKMDGICLTRRKRGLCVVLVLAAGLLATSPQVGSAQIGWRFGPCVPCPPTPSTATAQPGAATQPGPPVAATTPGPATGNAPEPSPAADLFAQTDVGAAGGAASAAPNMVGDFFGSGGLFIVFQNSTSSSVVGTAPVPGGAIPRFKMAEDTSPLPQDRVFFDYSYYHDVPINSPNPNINVNSYTPGFEKTFLDGLVSFELRLPMATTLDNNVYFDGTTSTSVGEIGEPGDGGEGDPGPPRHSSLVGRTGHDGADRQGLAILRS